MGGDKISVRFCPKCKSFKVKYVMGLANAFGLIPNQRCLDCGFEASTFPVLETTKNDLDKAVLGLKEKKGVANKKIKAKKNVKKISSKTKVGRKKK